MSLLPILIIGSPVAAGLLVFLLGERRHALRTALNLAGGLTNLALLALLVRWVLEESPIELRWPLLSGFDLLFNADALSVLFSTLSSVLWLLTTIYAIGYLEDAPHRSRFFGFFNLCVGATLGISLAGNMETFLIFYEVLTVSTYPLVVHRGTAEALRAGKIYLAYTVAGGTVLLGAVAWLRALAGPLEFQETGLLAARADLPAVQLIVIFSLLIAALGVKAALVPLHGWLPRAMVAPAPVSALLHAVAVVKAGAFGIVRVVYDLFGIGLAQRLGVTPWLASFAALTIIYGSLRALQQDDLKRRLAFSTVSQVSYIALGAAVIGPVATTGGVAHLVHQGLMKITLFFCAGNVAETLHVHRISEMAGVGRKMPWTMAAFTLAAFGMIGVPPLAGFVSKWYLAIGGLSGNQPWVVAVLLLSTALNASYFLPIIYTAYFESGKAERSTTDLRDNPAELPGAVHLATPASARDARLLLLIPTLTTAILAVLAGLLAGAPFSPLSWAQLIAAREYAP